MIGDRLYMKAQTYDIQAGSQTMTFQGSRAVNRAFTVAVSVKCGCHRLGDDVNFLLAFIFNFRFNQVSRIGLYSDSDVLLSALCDVQIQGPVLKYYYLSTMMELEKDRYRAGSAYQLASLA